MQSALGSLRQAGASQRVLVDAHHMMWGVGADHLSLAGHYNLRVLRGAISICGTTLTYDSSGRSFTVSAPVAPYPVIRAAHANNAGGAAESVPEELQNFPAIIEVRAAEIPDIGALAPPYKQLWHTIYQVNADETSALRIPKSWQEINFANDQFVVLGPKNSGKSSLSRFICNKLITDNKRVFYLDLDPGQPEFTVPGCLSLHKVSELNFSPGYFHPDFREVVKCLYLGYVSPSETPDRYLAMCHNLISIYNEQKQSGDRLVINTSGWTKGLGLELNAAIMSMLGDEAAVFHLGSSEFAEAEELEPIGDDDSSSTITQGGFSSAELRSLQIMQYMHQANLNHLTEWVPFEVKLSDLGIAILDSEGIDNQDWGICIEGTLVAIVLADSASEGILEPQKANNIWLESDCVGMAVVQKVNMHSLHLLIPRPLPEFGGRTPVLVRGRVQLPIWEIHNRKLGKSPWVSTSKPPGIGGTYSRFRRNIQR